MPTPTHAKLHVSVFVHSIMLLPGQMILMLLGLQAVAVVLPLHAQRHLIYVHVSAKRDLPDESNERSTLALPFDAAIY